MTFNLKNEKPVTGDVAGVYFVKNPDTPADNGIYVINVNGQAPIRMASAVNMDDYITAAIIASTYITKSNPTATTTPSINGRTKQLVTQDWIKRIGSNIVIGEDFTVDEDGKLPVELSTGVYNVLLGIRSGKNLTTGGVNLLIGNGVAPLLTTGWHNVGQGSDTLANITTGNRNVALITSALRYLITGDDNIAIGERAGTKTFTNDIGQLVTNLSYSIFLGKYAAAKNASGDVNEIVIGYNAQGQGSNTAVLGNDSITDTYLKGKVFANKIASTTANSTFIPNFSTAVYNDVPGSSYIESNDVDTNLNEFNIGDVVTVFDSNDEPVFQTTIASVVTHGTDLYTATLTDDPAEVYQQYVNGVYIEISRTSTNINIPTLDLEFGNTYKPSIASDSQKALLNANLQPRYNSLYNLGGASNLWKEVFSSTAAINTSDARLKTEISVLSQDELNAAKQLSKEIGTYKFLSAISEKGDKARKHIGMTVQRAIEIMTANNLNPFDYGFICYDEWQDEFRKVIDVHAQDYQPAWVEEIGMTEAKEACTETIVNEDGTETIIEHETIPSTPIVVNHPEIPAVEEVSHQEQIKVAGNMYSFRYTELLAFIAAGFEARLTTLENV